MRQKIKPYLLGQITQTLLTSTGRVAVTSGDFVFLIKSWQGWLIWPE